jgi:hypothetical protein
MKYTEENLKVVAGTTESNYDVVVEEKNEDKKSKSWFNLPLIMAFIFFLALGNTIGTYIAKNKMKTAVERVYEEGYIQGFRYARSYQVKDTVELNQLYPNLYFLKKYGSKK